LLCLEGKIVANQQSKSFLELTNIRKVRSLDNPSLVFVFLFAFSYLVLSHFWAAVLFHYSQPRRLKINSMQPAIEAITPKAIG
jgi:hypothetical protein